MFRAALGPVAMAAVMIAASVPAAEAAPRWKRAADTTPPQTTITAAPTSGTSSTSASFSFVSSESGSSFQCSLDAALFASCTSPRVYNALATGTHSFQVRARDAAGNMDATPATLTWQIAQVASTPTGQSTTRPVGSALLSDSDAAARVRRSSWEPRPQNFTANRRVPTQAELDAFKSRTAYPTTNAPVTGAFSGTTDEIIQWVSWKWGFDEDMLRAQAVQESWWDQATAGDGGVSFGLFQIKSTEVPETFPLSRDSTAFNADYAAAQLRWCYEGRLGWLNTVERGRDYAAGDAWGCLGVWYSGRWYTPSAVAYIDQIKQYVVNRRWAQAGF